MLKRKKKKKKYTMQTKEKIPLHSTVQHAQARTPKKPPLICEERAGGRTRWKEKLVSLTV